MRISSINIFNRELDKYLLKKYIKNFIFFLSISVLILFLIEFVELLRRTSEHPDISSTFYVLYLAFLKITERAFTSTGIIFQCHNKAEIADITIIKVKPPNAKIKVPDGFVISKGAFGALSAK